MKDAFSKYLSLESEFDRASRAVGPGGELGLVRCALLFTGSHLLSAIVQG